MDSNGPIIFANRVLQQLIEHSFGSDLVVEPEDYTALRVVFRNTGGNWERLWHGDITQLNLLNKIVVAWGKLPDRKHVSDTLV